MLFNVIGRKEGSVVTSRGRVIGVGSAAAAAAPSIIPPSIVYDNGSLESLLQLVPISSMAIALKLFLAGDVTLTVVLLNGPE